MANNLTDTRTLPNLANLTDTRLWLPPGAQVGRSLFEECITGVCRTKTVLLVTNALQVGGGIFIC